MARERAGLWPVAIHSVYLINLAAQDPIIQARSREAFRQEIERAIRLGADYLVVHPGNPKTAPAEVGIQTAVESIREAARGLKLNGEMTILIENTAGQGSAIGCDFEQVADIVAALDGLPVGVCLDTAHTFASGYDISTEAGLKATLRAIKRSFGFERIKLIHSNDSKAPLGSRVDRHQHIGLGHIGADAFRRMTQKLEVSAHTIYFRNSGRHRARRRREHQNAPGIGVRMIQMHSPQVDIGELNGNGSRSIHPNALPNYQKAVILREKLEGYVLNPTHEATRPGGSMGRIKQ